jgi:predicted MPP superfamily phosphohydrolase
MTSVDETRPLPSKATSRASSLLRILGMVVFALIAFGIVAAAHRYLAQRLVLDAGLVGASRQVLLAALGILGASLLLQPLAERVLRPPWSRFVAWPASLWMGLFFYLVVLTGASDLILSLGESTARAAGSELTSDGAARLRAILVGLVAFVAVAVGLRNGLAPPPIKRVELELDRWPRARDGYRIVQISDIHIGPILGRRFARDLTNRVNAMNADLVAVTGDLVDGRVDCLIDEVAPFGELAGRDGVFFVTGNHDHYSGASSWSGHVASLGMRVLRNEHLILGEGEHGFALVGVDDHHAHFIPGEHGEDLARALEGIEDPTPVVLLAHDPSTFKKASKFPIDLQLSGHTHGGQIWPFSMLVRLVVPFLAGLYHENGTTLYVSRGTGFWGPPMRLGAPAEITEIVLRSKQCMN